MGLVYPRPSVAAAYHTVCCLSVRLRSLPTSQQPWVTFFSIRRIRLVTSIAHACSRRWRSHVGGFMDAIEER